MAQSLERQVIGSAGVFESTSAGSLSYTVGECVTNTMSASSVILTQGFQQPPFSTVSVKKIIHENTDIKVYPNPVTDVVYVAISPPGNGNFSVVVWDTHGRLLQVPAAVEYAKNQASITLDLSTYAPGIYLVSVLQNNGTYIKNIKLSKIN
ncbi:MAG: Secretion system C-terminal sorting domain [Flavipsychrobacter sp.]|jgi:hypothetical protein|nr:Secretion system C-terminal sorting domain [Flavipsychrobacter sp.]